MRVAWSTESEERKKRYQRQKVTMKVLEASFYNNLTVLMRKTRKIELNAVLPTVLG